jgi:hypothetical protein
MPLTMRRLTCAGGEAGIGQTAVVVSAHNSAKCHADAGDWPRLALDLLGIPLRNRGRGARFSYPVFIPGSRPSSLILKRASLSRSSGQWSEDDYDVLENGVVVGRIFFLDAVGPQGRPWMWASGHNGDIKRAAHGYETTREAAMAAFAKSWRTS